MEELSIVFLEREDSPEWFYLDFLPAVGQTAIVPRLLLGIAEDPLQRCLAFLTADVFTGDLEKDFLRDIEKPWGFGGVLEPYSPSHWIEGQDIKAVEGFKEFSIAIPQIEKDIGECQVCGGKKKDRYDLECLHCGGTGRETEMEWRQIDRVAATLSILSEVILDKPDKKLLVDLDTKRKQLLSVCLGFGGGTSRYIGAVLARPFGDYLRSISRQKLPEVQAAIKAAYLQMFPSWKRFNDHSYLARVDANGQLLMDVPGNACSLYVDGFDDCLSKASGSITLHCHNVDGAHQQISLLCGLAALTGMARKKLYHESPP